MKKYITIAALLAAGTACANAAIVQTLSADEILKGSYTFETPSIGSGYGNFSIVMALDAVAFQDAIKSGTNSTNLLFVTGNSNNIIGTGLNYLNDERGLYGAWTQGETSSPARVFTSPAGQEYSISTSLKTLFTNETFSSIGLSVSISGAGTKLYLTLIDNNGGATTLTGTNGGLMTKSFGSLKGITFNTTFVDYLQIDDSWNGHNVSVYEGLNKAAIEAAAVPEPSAFGLLAGLGALALVASRRRRK